MPGRVIVLAGPACSGKSTLASAVAQRLGCPHLEMDATRARLLPEAAHTREDRRVAYRAMAWAAGLLAVAQDVVLDAPYGHTEDRRDIEEIGRPFFLIECRIDAAEAGQRFVSRDRGFRLDLTRGAVEEMATAYPYSGCGLTLDTGAMPVAECLDRIARYIESGTPQRLWAGS